MGERGGLWTTSTVLVAVFCGFALGFLACHKLYEGVNEKVSNCVGTSRDCSVR